MNTKPSTVTRAPIWVLDPKTNLEVDVAPFLETLEVLDTIYDSSTGEGGVAAVRSLMRTLNLTEYKPSVGTPDQLVDRYYDLHRLEDMFTATRSREVTES